MLAGEAQKFIDRLNRHRPKSLSEQTPQEARAYVAAQAKLGHKKHFPDLKITDIIVTHHPEKLEKVEVHTPLRFYRPVEGQKLPLILYFHGGGFVAGNLDYVDSLCQHLSVESGALVVSVDYHLAPEYPFPFPVWEGSSLLQTLFLHADAYRFDPTKICIMGDSAGANLAAVITHQNRKDIPISAQVLLYPVTDFSGDYPSHTLFHENYFLSKDNMDWSRQHYLQDLSHVKDPLASPLWDQDIAELPKTLVITAECDPLRDEGRAYAAHLIQAGNEVYCHEYSGMIHCFVTFYDFFPLNAGKALREVCNFLKF